ncbi:hypothetical protein KEM44_21010 [Sinorhizobium meliloti]|uniref:hypothetical protein n=1 Tax=Rhizobium meliloti TaxID=382 RepID=UPI000B5AA014|nr:hypothetical protein [Sinorhizobium meliloti]ASJ58968.1 hypothetical protein SMB554_07050 [Sinorhizobium meliloti]MCK3783502.1 hypothetical protein [Sinorhizobium meliloti]MCK3787868.1 hypothetical protein [Sinorhizobium meliloti]MCK3794855.1 hypothetical protein [Sinorhizobium meliloti]UTG98610.1 hypothetical protein KEM44_21010 [Sinorhizobium meliloti]
MLEIARDPLTWFIASVVSAGWMGFLFYWFCVREARRRGFVEPEPEVDADLLEAELMMEFARVKA